MKIDQLSAAEIMAASEDLSAYKAAIGAGDEIGASISQRALQARVSRLVDLVPVGEAFVAFVDREAHQARQAIAERRRRVTDLQAGVIADLAYLAAIRPASAA